MASASGPGLTAGEPREPAGRPSPPFGLTLLAGGIAVAVLLPVAWLVLRVGGVPVDRALALVTGGRMLHVLANSVALVAVVTAASVVVGVPFAFLVVRTDLPAPRVVTVLVSLPLVIPSYVGAFAFVSAFGSRGELADALAPLGVQSIPPIDGFLGTALVLTLFTYPYVFLTTRAALRSLDGRLVEAARTLNHGRWAAFRRVTLPQILPGVAAGSLLVALYTLSDFGTPAIMGLDVFTRVIFVEYNAFGRDFAALLSLQLLVVTALILVLEGRLSREASTYGGARGRAGRSLDLGRLRLPALAAVAVVVGLALALPVGVLFLWLLRAPAAGGGFTFQWVTGWHSVYVAALAAGASAIVAVPVAYLSASYRSRLGALFERATYVGYAMPGVVLGLALVFFGSSYAPALYQTIPLLVFAYVVRFLPQAVGSTRSSLLQIDPSLAEAARTLGRSPLGAFRTVTLPLVAPGLIAGTALVFLTTMKELPATLLLRPTGFDTLVTYIWRVQDAGYYGQAALPALALVGISGLSMLVLLRSESNDVG